MAPLYAYYGDDFTGSTDELEALALAGVRAVLFTGMPVEERWREFADCQAFGIAGESRSRQPEWMSEHLPAIFARLGALGAPMTHLRAGRSTVIYSALGPLPAGAQPGGEALGRRAGALLRRILVETSVQRVVLAGGDTGPTQSASSAFTRSPGLRASSRARRSVMRMRGHRISMAYSLSSKVGRLGATTSSSACGSGVRPAVQSTRENTTAAIITISATICTGSS